MHGKQCVKFDGHAFFARKRSICSAHAYIYMTLTPHDRLCMNENLISNVSHTHVYRISHRPHPAARIRSQRFFHARSMYLQLYTPPWSDKIPLNSQIIDTWTMNSFTPLPNWSSSAKYSISCSVESDKKSSVRDLFASMFWDVSRSGLASRMQSKTFSEIDRRNTETKPYLSSKKYSSPVSFLNSQSINRLPSNHCQPMMEHFCLNRLSSKVWVPLCSANVDSYHSAILCRNAFGKHVTACGCPWVIWLPILNYGILSSNDWIVQCLFEREIMLIGQAQR